jgi:hypothetical protein
MDLAFSLLAAIAPALLIFFEEMRDRRRSPKANLTLSSEELDAATRVLREEFSQTRTGSPGGAGAGSPTSTPTQTPAELEALAIMSVYGKNLMAEANRIAKRAGAERPSKKHVRLAAERVGPVRDQPGVVPDLALAVGAILIGAAVSYQINLWTGGRSQDAGVGLLMALLLAAGVGLTVTAVFLKWRKS